MGKNWKCRIGFHDWCQIECLSENEIEECALRRVNGYSPAISSKEHVKMYEKKICLRCKERVDEITLMLSKRTDEIRAEIMRKSQAKKLWRKAEHEG